MRRKMIQIQLYPVPPSTIYDRTSDIPEDFESFCHLSVELTGFSLAELQGTGMLRAYFDELGLILGRGIRRKYFASDLGAGDLLRDALWGPVTRNVIRMWYLGQWKKLPVGWGSGEFPDCDSSGFDEFGKNVDRIISSRAYVEGLAWRAIGVNPMGAKQPGFASWTEAPK